jgi:hypothetical protein
MIAALIKILLPIFEEELAKQSPVIQSYLSNEINTLIDYIKNKLENRIIQTKDQGG